jgi:putative hemolysin
MPEYMDEPLPSLLAAAGSTLIGALFAAADTALTSLSSARLGALIEQEQHGGHRAALERIRRSEAAIRSRYLVGRVLCSAVTAVFFYEAVPIFLVGVSSAVAQLVAVCATAVVTGFAFEVSTTLARKHADHFAPRITRYLKPLELVLAPVALPLGWVGAYLGRRSASDANDPHVTEAEVEILVDEVERSGLFGREPAEMIKNVLEFVDLTAHHVMVPRSKMEAVSQDIPMTEVRALVVESGHSRYPVYLGEVNNVVGLLYAKDVFKAFDGPGDSPADGATVAEIMRKPVTFVHENQSLSSLLREMRSRRQHMFMVVDEFGTVSGLVTLEDILEEIVGDIRDEHDVGEPAPIRMMDDGSLVADADVSIGDLSDYLGADIPTDEEYVSLGGMLTHAMGRVPETGAVISKFGLRFVVRASDDKQVAEVQITKAPTATTEVA